MRNCSLEALEDSDKHFNATRSPKLRARVTAVQPKGVPGRESEAAPAKTVSAVEGTRNVPSMTLSGISSEVSCDS